MDRRARRLRRSDMRSRRTRIGVAVVAAVAAVAVVLSSTLGGAQESPAKPPPKVGEVDLTPAPAPVGAGWEGQVGTDANLVGVQWNGDPGAEFTVEVRNGRGEWRRASDIGANDAVPDPGSPDATAAAARADTLRDRVPGRRPVQLPPVHASLREALLVTRPTP